MGDSQDLVDYVAILEGRGSHEDRPGDAIGEIVQGQGVLVQRIGAFAPIDLFGIVLVKAGVDKTGYPEGAYRIVNGKVNSLTFQIGESVYILAGPIGQDDPIVLKHRQLIIGDGNVISVLGEGPLQKAQAGLIAFKGHETRWGGIVKTRRSVFGRERGSPGLYLSQHLVRAKRILQLLEVVIGKA